MDDERTTQEHPAPTTVNRRAVIRTGAKLAYAAPVVAATYSFAGRPAGATDDDDDDDDDESGCACPEGTVEIPAHRLLRRHFSHLIGKCLGCKTGPIKPLRTTDLPALCGKIGKVVSSVCPGDGNSVTLTDKTCPPISM